MLATRNGGPRQTGQALVELALVAPLLLFLGFGVLAVGRIAQAHMAVSAVADEAALAAAGANSADAAAAAGIRRGQQVASGYDLTVGALGLSVDARDFSRGGQVRATARYTVSLQDLPLLSWAKIPIVSTHVAPIDAYRSDWPGGGAP